ncbi:MAG TPA: flagellar basal body P-ring formation chaperone FlgA, partial [Myxococcota bacterium]|nr:flagellar basal body P-ring formation chaperone FlgA [Myxococcota bacterium]
SEAAPRSRLGEKRRAVGRRLGARGVLLAALVLAGPTAAIAGVDALGEAQVRADLERHIRAHVEAPSAEIEIPALAAFHFDRSRHPGALRTSITTRSSTPYRDRVPFTVELYAGDRLVARNVVTAAIRVPERVVVPLRDLPRGAVLAAGDLGYAERDGGRLPNDALHEVDQAIGLRLLRALRRDDVLREAALERVPLVERGDRVMLVLEQGALRIQAIGQAREAGGLGEWIRVVNLDSKRELSGRIDREGRVHVAF